MDISSPVVSADFRQAVIPSIMAGSNAHALDILRDRGIPGVIPGIGPVCIPHECAAEFYGVRPEYLRNLMANTDLSRSKIRGDFRDMKVSDLPPEVAACINRDVPANSKFIDLVYSKEMQDSLAKVYGLFKHDIVLPADGFTVYSPRLVLAMALLFPKSRANSINAVSAMVRRIKKSAYRCVPVGDWLNKVSNYPSMDFKLPEKDIPVVSQVRDFVPAHNAAPQFSIPVPASLDDGIPVLPNGGIVLSPEVFAGMIKVAVKEAVSEVVSQLDIPVKEQPVQEKPSNENPKSTESRGGRGKRLRRPDNWNTVLSQYLTGEISQKKAARMTGMCVSSFQKYAHGVQVF